MRHYSNLDPIDQAIRSELQREHERQILIEMGALDENDCDTCHGHGYIDTYCGMDCDHTRITCPDCAGTKEES